MRIEGIQLQGFRQPGGEHHLELGPGYTLIVVPERATAAALRGLLLASLYPESCATALLPFLEPTGSEPQPGGARTSLTLRAEGAAGGVLRVLSLPTRKRVYLGRLDTRAKGWRRVASQPSRIESGLHRLGWPGSRTLFEEWGFGWSAASSNLAAEAALREELERAVEARRTLVPLERRIRELRDARKEREDLERDLSQQRESIESLSSRAEALAGIRERVERYRSQLAKRERERDQVGRLRLGLLDERARLRVVPAAQRPWMWLGLALALAGAAAARAVGSWLGLFALSGLFVFGLALWRSESARRRLESLDRRLATLRVRERSVEREFEAETVGVRGLLATLGVDSTEALVQEADRIERASEKLAPLQVRWELAQACFSESAAAELAELEGQATELTSGPKEPDLRARLARLREEGGSSPRLSLPDPGAPRPESFAGVLPLYLRSLGGGRVRDARAGASGWSFVDLEGSDLVLDPIPGAWVLALRLAAIEAAAHESGAAVPLLVGPALPDLQASEREALARALRRLGQLVQVVQVSLEEEPWKARASRVVTLGSVARR